MSRSKTSPFLLKMYFYLGSNNLNDMALERLLLLEILLDTKKINSKEENASN